MDASIVIIAGVCIFFNFAIILYKFKAGRYLDMVVDSLVLGAITYMTAGSATGFVAGMIGSALFSVFLMIVNPMKGVFDDDEYYEEEIPAHA